MRILEYIDLDTSGVAKTYRKVATAIAAGDFRAAQVKKLSNLTHGKFYRARLDDANRLLFTLVRHGDEVCALMLEVIANHDYDKSRFLRGASIDESKIPDCDLTQASAEAQPLRYMPGCICWISQFRLTMRKRPFIASQRPWCWWAAPAAAKPR